MKELIKKYLNQRNRNIISLFIIIFGIGYLVNYSFYTPTYINKYIATNIYKEPANVYFEDENFYQCVVDAYNKENSTKLPYTTNLSDEELLSITKLNCRGNNKSDDKKIVSTKGLEKLTALTSLDVGSNQLTSIDVSKNTALNTLSVSNNQLTSLDVSKNTVLKDLYVEKSQLTSIDISKNTELRLLWLYGNQLTNINTNVATALKTLDVGSNQLTSIDVSKNTALTSLHVGINQLTSIDVSKNTNLIYLEAYNNQLTSIDVSKNTELTFLDVGGNRLTSIDVSKNISLTSLDVGSNQLTSIDVSKNAVLTHIDVLNNKLSTLDVSKNAALTHIDVRNNKLSTLDVSKNISLISLDVGGNQLTELDVSKNTSLESLDLGNFYLDRNFNELTELDVSKNTALTKLNVNNNKLTSLDVSKNRVLKELYVGKNQLTNLDVSQNTALTEMYASSNNFNVEMYIYKGDSTNAINNVKAASGSKWANPTWESNDTNIATVSESGEISTLKTGNVTISGTVSDSYTTKNNVHVIEITSNKYKIDDNNIYVLSDKDVNTIKSNLVIPEGIAVDVDLNNKNLKVKHGNDILKEFNLVMLDSDKYQIYDNDIVLYNDLDINTIKSNIIINSNKITLEGNNNKLLIKYSDEVLKEYNIVGYSSNKYDLSKDNIMLQGESNIDLDSINVVNCTKEVIDNKLVIKYKNNIIKEFNINKGIEFGNLRVSNYSIVLDKNTTISYKEFTDNITVEEGYSYKIYNDNNIVNDGNIVGGMVLKVYYNEEEVDSYNITYDYVEFSKDIVVDNHNNILEKVKHKTTVDGIRNIISTNGNVSIFDKNNNKITDNSKKIGTGYKVRIEGSNQVYEYLISVKGDSTGDGEVNVRDIVDVANTIVKNRNLDRVYYNASDYYEDDTINVRDIVGIANYIVNGK